MRFAQKINQLTEIYNFTVIDRMDYVCPLKKCKLVSDSLGKYFFDMGHHTLLGAMYFASVLDNENIFNTFKIIHE